MKHDLKLQLDESPGTPIFLNLAGVIIREVGRGRLQPGTALPGTRALARTLGIHRNTVAAAYHELILQGWIQTQPSRGTFIAHDLVRLAGKSASSRTRKVAARKPADAKPAPTLAFSDGAPDARIAPHAQISRAFRRALTAPAFLRGSAYGDPRGGGLLRSALADYLSHERGLAMTAEDVLVTRGSQMALFLAARALLEPGDAVVAENPGYPLAWAAFRAAGARVIGVPIDAQGVSIDHIARLAQRERRLKAIYVTPHHQYPTTVTLGAGRRLALLDLAHRHGLTLIEDDYDHEYRFEGRPILPLAARAPHGIGIVYIGSLSKLLAPGIRLGYAVATPEVLSRMANLREAIDRQGDVPLEHAVSRLITDGELQRHARKARRIYRDRRDLLVQQLRRHLDGAISFEVPAGGLAIWANVHEADAQDWARRAAKVGLEIIPGTHFALDPDAASQSFRLGYASLDAVELSRATKLLARARTT